MFTWRKRRMEDTQPIPTVTQNKIDAIKALQEARVRHGEAAELNATISDRARQLEKAKNDNHFYDSFVSIIRME